MKRSLIALSLLALGAPSVFAAGSGGIYQPTTSGAAKLDQMACTLGPRSAYSGGVDLVGPDPVSYECYLTKGMDDGIWTDQGPKMTLEEYNLMLLKRAGLRADPRIIEATRQAAILQGMPTYDKARAREDVKGGRGERVELQPDGKFKTVARGRSHANELDMFAVKAMQRNVSKAQAAIKLALADPNNTGDVARHREGLTAECNSEAFRARLDLQTVDDILRKSMITAFEKRCAAKATQQAEANKKRAALSAEMEASAETPWELEPVLPIFSADEADVGSAVLAMADSGELASFSIIVNPNRPTYTLVLDNSPKSKLLYLLLQPRVRQKELNLRIIPTSLYSEDANLAAEMLELGGFVYMYRWMALPNDWKASYKASAETLGKVKQNNEKLLAAQLNGVPFRIHTTANGKTTPGFGLFADKDFSFKDWPDRSWNPEQLKRINKETTLLIGRERSAQACPNQKADWTEEGGTVDGKETWKMTTKINFLTGCDYSKGGLPAGYSSGAQR